MYTKVKIIHCQQKWNKCYIKGCSVWRNMTPDGNTDLH